MGQYYKFMNIDKKEKCERNRDLMKLTEHSYLANEYCGDILQLLSNEWKGDRILHVGDYAEPNDNTLTANLIEKINNELNIPSDDTLYNYGETFTEVSPTTRKSIRYVYNLDKEEYIDLYKQPIQWVCCSDKYINFAKFNSFALLTGCGNGLGGGDYGTVNEEYVGYWSGDRFVSSSEPIKEYDNYESLNIIFSENKEYESLSIYNNEEILKCEKDFFIKELDYFNKNNRISKGLIIDKKGLTNDEKALFENSFNKYIDNLNKESDMEI